MDSWYLTGRGYAGTKAGRENHSGDRSDITEGPADRAHSDEGRDADFQDRPPGRGPSELNITLINKNGHSNILDSKPPCSPQMRQPQGMATITPAIEKHRLFCLCFTAGVIVYPKTGKIPLAVFRFCILVTEKPQGFRIQYGQRKVPPEAARTKPQYTKGALLWN